MTPNVTMIPTTSIWLLAPFLSSLETEKSNHSQLSQIYPKMFPFGFSVRPISLTGFIQSEVENVVSVDFGMNYLCGTRNRGIESFLVLNDYSWLSIWVLSKTDCVIWVSSVWAWQCCRMIRWWFGLIMWRRRRRGRVISTSIRSWKRVFVGKLSFLKGENLSIVELIELLRNLVCISEAIFQRFFLARIKNVINFF